MQRAKEDYQLGSLSFLNSTCLAADDLCRGAALKIQSTTQKQTHSVLMLMRFFTHVKRSSHVNTIPLQSYDDAGVQHLPPFVLHLHLLNACVFVINVATIAQITALLFFTPKFNL